MERNQIYITCGTEYQEMTKELLKECALAELIGDRKKRIAIKPNLVSASDPSNGATTHREILAGIMEYLRGHGFQNIVLTEGSWVGEKTADAFRACGYQEICERYDVPFHDTQKDKGVSTDCGGMKLNICSSVGEIDFLINVPARIRFITTGFPPSSKSRSPQILSTTMKSCRIAVFRWAMGL